MFVDRVTIEVIAGKGGDGCVSFFRSKGMNKGGPNGGDGGRGGDIIFESDEGLNTLFEFKGRRDWTASPGEDGRGKQQHGADGQDRVIRVPPGTLIYDAETDELVADIGPDNSRQMIVKGGRGGFGNEHFKSSTNQAPRKAIPGQRGQRRTVRLELKLIAEVGLVGLPNAGKSTLLGALTRARPKVGNYPFTTLAPHLGAAEVASPNGTMQRVIIADIPGLIEGAADGAGLGHDFLRHIERTSLILHVVDIAPIDGSEPADNYRLIRSELEGYASSLAEKPEIIALNKADLIADDADLIDHERRFRSGLKLGAETDTILISGASGHGIDDLGTTLADRIHGKQADGWS